MAEREGFDILTGFPECLSYRGFVAPRTSVATFPNAHYPKLLKCSAAL